MNIFTTGNERQLTADYGMYLTLTADVEAKHLPLVKIVHLPLTESTGDWQEIGEDRAAEIRAAKAAAAGNVAELARQVTQLGEQTAATRQAAQQAQQTARQAAQQNASQARLTAMLINTYALSDEQALEVKDLYPAWEDLVGQALTAGYKLTYNGDLYKVIQAHTAQSDWLPSATPALYGLVGTEVSEEGEHAGTREDPIPYEQMMVIEQGKYYTQDGILYVGLMDAPNGYPNDLKDLATLAQKVTE